MTKTKLDVLGLVTSQDCCELVNVFAAGGFSVFVNEEERGKKAHLCLRAVHESTLFETKPPNKSCYLRHSKQHPSHHMPLSHLLELIIQNVRAHVGHHLPTRCEHWALTRIELVKIGEADVVALADGVQVLHVAVGYQGLKLVAEGIVWAGRRGIKLVWSVPCPVHLGHANHQHKMSSDMLQDTKCIGNCTIPLPVANRSLLAMIAEPINVESLVIGMLTNVFSGAGSGLCTQLIHVLNA